MSDWAQLERLALTWSGLFAALAGLVLALFLRRLLPQERRRRGRATIVILIAAPLLHFVAHGLGALGAHATAGVLHIAIVVLLGFGATGILGMLVFDIALGRTSVPTIARDVLQTAAFLFIVLGALSGSGVNPLSVLTTSAVLTAVIGLAFQNIMANLLSGIALQIDRTFAIGDWIQVGARVGKIAQIRWRSTSILTREGDTVVIPNAQLLSNEVLNFSKPRGAHKATVKIAFHFRHPPNEVRRAALEAIRGVPGILDDPAPACAPAEFTEEEVTYGVRYWIEDVAAEGRIEGEVRTRLWYAAQRAGLEGPCPAPAPATPEALAARAGALRAMGLLSPLADAEIERLAAAARELCFAEGEHILDEGDPGDSLYLVRSGDVEVVVGRGDTRRDVATLGPGDFFGEMSLMTGEPRRASCAAATDATLLVVGRDAFQAILAEDPAIAGAISSLLARREAELAGDRGRGEARQGDDERSTRLLGRIRAYFHMD